MAPRPSGRVPLVRALSKLGFASRREAAALVAAGRVRIDDRLATDPNALVVPERIHVAIDDAPKTRAARRLIALHKPRGVVTTRRDPEGRRTVFDVLGEAGADLITVGRLDLTSTGLLLCTNDTRLAAWLTDPSRRVPREYVVTVRGRVQEQTLARLRYGIDVTIAGRRERISADDIVVRKSSGRETHLIVTLTEGKNREIRRLFDAAGHEVTRLHRITFGPFTLGRLAPGEWREVEAKAIPSRTF